MNYVDLYLLNYYSHSFQPSQYSKLEKADVLDMAVRYVQSLRQQQQNHQLASSSSATTGAHQDLDASASATSNPLPTNMSSNQETSFSNSQYQAGFSQCSSEIEVYLRMLENIPCDLPDKVAKHLNSLLSKMNTETVERNCSSSNQFTSPTLQPILLLFNPIQTTPVPIMGNVATDNAPQQINMNIVSTSATLPASNNVNVYDSPLCNTQALHVSHGNDQLFPGLTNSSRTQNLMSPNESPFRPSADGATPCSSPCNSTMSEKSPLNFLYFSDDTETNSTETVTMYRSDDSFSEHASESMPLSPVNFCGKVSPVPGPTNLAGNCTTREVLPSSTLAEHCHRQYSGSASKSCLNLAGDKIQTSSRVSNCFSNFPNSGTQNLEVLRSQSSNTPNLNVFRSNLPSRSSCSDNQRGETLASYNYLQEHKKRHIFVSPSGSNSSSQSNPRLHSRRSDDDYRTGQEEKANMWRPWH